MNFKVEAPPLLAQARGGLLPLANVITTDAEYAAFHGVKYQARPSARKLRPVPGPGQDKTFDQTGEVDGVKFATYGGLETPLLMGQPDEAEARRMFEASEGYSVEENVQRLLLNASAVDLTPTAGTPVTNAKAAVGLLHQYAAERYEGLPLLHANHYVTELLDDVEVGDDWKLHTRQGVPVANGAGYSAAGPASQAAPAGAGWLYISGQINLWRGATTVIPTSDLKTNRNYVLAEAAYAATVDTFVAAILVGV